MLLALALLCGSAARADSVQVVTQELKADSVLPLRQNVTGMWATNLLYAQSAITLEAAIWDYDLSWCDPSNCTPANIQSTIAINPDATISITIDKPVSTEKPAGLILILMGVAAMVALAWWFFKSLHRSPTPWTKIN